MSSVSSPDPSGEPGEPGEAQGETEKMLQDLRKEHALLRRELDEAKSTMAVAECVKESMVELERQKNSLEEELATMQQLLNEAHDEASIHRTSYEHQLAKTKAIVSQLEHENQELKVHMKLGGPPGPGGDSSMIVDKETILGGAAVLSDATKSFARRMKSNLLPPLGMSGSGVEKNSSPSPLHATASSPVLQQGSSSSLSLEDGMKKAYEDTELLKSIVVPLEEQIGALKNKLRETDTLLREHEVRQTKLLLGAEGLAKWLEGKTLEEARTSLLEKSGDDDLVETKEGFKENLYVSLLCTRYSLLSSELSSSKRETKEVVDLLSKERETVKNLKQESVIATSEMVKAQKEHLAEITRLYSVLTEDQKIALTNLQSPTAKEEASKTISPASSSPDSSPSRHESLVSDDSTTNMARIVSNVEWDEMQKELSKVRALLGVSAGDSIIGSDQYRALQSELIDLKKQKAQLVKQVEKFKDEMKQEAEYRRQVEESWQQKAEQQRSETEIASIKVAELEGSLQDVRTAYTSMYDATRMDLLNLTKDREKIVRELKTVQKENDILVGKHDATSEEMQNEVINLPDKPEDMQLLLLKFREGLIAAKIAKERTEEKLKAEIGFLKTQIQGEEQSKRGMEEHFNAELIRLQNHVRNLQEFKKETLHELKREEHQRQDISALKQDLDAARSEKQLAEAKLGECKSKISILQQELDNSVAVQNDFVRLSQSLQMELEKIRQSEKEVRWQHEDDVENCQNCNLALTLNKRNKHHCRHCGRIFCSDCVTKKVQSGPRQRQAKVCDVCHTLLVQNSAPYFSTEAPHAN